MKKPITLKEFRQRHRDLLAKVQGKTEEESETRVVKGQNEGVATRGKGE